ncbi:MAG TPA: aspartyl protease family protein [Planctomycetota bacterium]|nr:aspartyl protease family protein [Planctomycetota bacterium]
MSRIIKTIEIEGKPATALFDTGALYSYVVSRLVGSLPKRTMAPPVRVGLGGSEIEVREFCIMEGTIEGLEFMTDAVVVDDLGRIDGHALDVIFGARSMEQWEIQLDSKAGTLDLEGLRRREFTEY